MCSVQQVVRLSMITKYLRVLAWFPHVTYLYRDNITYSILILLEKRICVHFHVMRAKSSANIVVDITGKFFFLLSLFLISSFSIITSASWSILLKWIHSLSCFLLLLGCMERLFDIYWFSNQGCAGDLCGAKQGNDLKLGLFWKDLDNTGEHRNAANDWMTLHH